MASLGYSLAVLVGVLLVHVLVAEVFLVMLWVASFLAGG